MQDIKNTLYQILTIIGYTDDKTAFVDELISVCYKQAVVDLVQSLPLEKQARLKEQTNSDDWQKILEQYGTSDNVNNTVAKAIQSHFLSFLRAIDSTLRPYQRKNLDTFMESLTPPQPSQLSS